MPKISYYFQELENKINTSDSIQEIINIHTMSFEKNGWEVISLNESDARNHPLYEKFNDSNSILAKSVNPWEYTRACYMRWLAYATAEHPFADFDVINYGFTPNDANLIKKSDKTNCPIFLSQAGAVGLFEPTDYNKLLNVYLEFIANPIIAGPLLEDINDMTIMRHLRMEWYNSIPYNDDRFAKDYTRQGWDSAKLVHYPHGLTDIPRAATIKLARKLPM